MKFILTFIADDRPGLVDRISETVKTNGGNWLDSRMAHLATKFAGIALVEIEDAKASALESALIAMKADGFHLLVEDAPDDMEERGVLFDIELLGPDQPGIVQDVSRILAEREISVETMDTDIQDAPHSGGTLFHAHASIRAPKGIDDADLSEALEGLGDRLVVDVTVDKVP